MEKTYFKPAFKNIEKMIMTAESQYIFVVSPDECPILASFGLKNVGSTFQYCEDDCEAVPPESVLITCANIPGEYSVEISTATDGGPLDCGIAESCVATFTVDPELPGDCIINTYVTEGHDNCSLGV
jgi:hypothetical protein